MKWLVSFLCMTCVAFAQDANDATPGQPESKPVAEQREVSQPMNDSAPRDGEISQAGRRAATSADRLDLETTIVTGNRELPKVLYIVPWKKAELGELPAQPFNTLLDEVLKPVDRDVFRREVKYFDAVTRSGASTASTTPVDDR